MNVFLSKSYEMKTIESLKYIKMSVLAFKLLYLI